MRGLNDIRLVAAGAVLAASTVAFGVVLGRALIGPDLEVRVPAAAERPVAEAAPAPMDQAVSAAPEVAVEASPQAEAVVAAVEAGAPGEVAGAVAGRPIAIAGQAAARPARRTNGGGRDSSAPVTSDPMLASTLAAIELAADQDPFQPDRQRAPAYGVTVEAPRVEREEPPTPPQFNVIGVVSSPVAGFAMIQVDAGAPQLVAVGESIEGYELLEVTDEQAVLRGAAGRLAYAVGDPAVPQQRNNRNNRNNNNNNNRNDEPQANAAAAAAAVVRGAAALPPDQLQNLRQAIQAGAQVILQGNAMQPEQLRQLMQSLQNAQPARVQQFQTQDGRQAEIRVLQQPNTR
ncbi:MAG TPA: hypothetical protein VNZ57_15800 [Longimicrobiales bacterium]|nr:hypothetical protein [Longimicrobiales bacterium]